MIFKNKFQTEKWQHHEKTLLPQTPGRQQQCTQDQKIPRPPCLLPAHKPEKQHAHAAHKGRRCGKSHIGKARQPEKYKSHIIKDAEQDAVICKILQQPEQHSRQREHFQHHDNRHIPVYILKGLSAQMQRRILFIEGFYDPRKGISHKNTVSVRRARIRAIEDLRDGGVVIDLIRKRHAAADDRQKRKNRHQSQEKIQKQIPDSVPDGLAGSKFPGAVFFI